MDAELSNKDAIPPQGWQRPPLGWNGLAVSAGVFGFLTLISRVLGFVRDILFAIFFGTSIAAEAFVVGFKIPNLFRDMVGEGAMNAAIVPVLAEEQERLGSEGVARLGALLAAGFLLILGLVTSLGVVFAPVVVRFAAPGFVIDPEKYNLTVTLTRVLFPFVFLIGLSALLMGILNTLRIFSTSAVGPILLNLVMIVSFFVLVPRWGITGLAAAVLVGGALQVLVQVFSIGKLGRTRAEWRPRALLQHFKHGRASFGHPAIARILKLLVPRIWGTGVYQISVFVDTILASFYWIVGMGGQSALYYSSRLFQLPLAVFGVSLAQVSLPTLSSHAARDEMDSFRSAVAFSVKSVLFLTLPAAAGLAIFSEPIITILFRRGQFDAYSAAITSSALFFYAFGLAGAAVTKNLVSAFYAVQDTRTPVRAATLALGANILLNLVFMAPLKIGGLALATSIATTLHALYLYGLLERRIGAFERGAVVRTIVKSSVSVLGMGLAGIFVLKPWVDEALAQGAKYESALRLFLSIALSVALYFALSMILKSEEAGNFRKLFGRNARPS